VPERSTDAYSLWEIVLVGNITSEIADPPDKNSGQVTILCPEDCEIEPFANTIRVRNTGPALANVVLRIPPSVRRDVKVTRR